MRSQRRLIALGVVGLLLLGTLTPMYSQATTQPSWSPAPLQQSPPTPFLFPPYYGTEQVNSVFDHEYPLHGDEGSISPTRTNVITTVVHYDGTRWTGTVISCTLGTPSCYSGHSGIDYSLRYERVRACANGTVVAAGWQDPRDHRAEYGLRVSIEHNNGYRCTCGHLSVVAVDEGTPITDAGTERGRIVAISGNTGFSTGAHLHFAS